MLGLHPDLRRHQAAALAGGGVVGELGAFMLVAAFVDLPVVSEVPTGVLIGFGLVFLVVGYLGVVVAPRWYREASRIVTSGRPIAATVTLTRDEDSESTSLSARLHPGAAATAARGEVPLLVPRWDVSPLLDAPLEVGLYVDTGRNRVVAIATERGLLWSTPYYRRRESST